MRNPNAPSLPSLPAHIPSLTIVSTTGMNTHVRLSRSAELHEQSFHCSHCYFRMLRIVTIEQSCKGLPFQCSDDSAMLHSRGQSFKPPSNMFLL
ncbi:hypothetical protein QL285_080336 [Trifolium repens]|nr:hypothetical protein QL285_080336 [Trifolium repens]